MRYSLLVCLLLCNVSFGAKCNLSKKHLNNYEPEVFNLTNNLLSDYKNLPENCSSQITLKGRILDEECHPVPYARVYIWQVGCDGKYPYYPLRTKINYDLINLDTQNSFLGSGMAITDKDGVFSFITIYPCSKIKHINFKVQSKKIQTLYTKIEIKADSPTPPSQYQFDLVVQNQKSHTSKDKGITK